MKETFDESLQRKRRTSEVMNDHLQSFNEHNDIDYCALDSCYQFIRFLQQRQLLIITTCTLDYVLVCLFCYRLCSLYILS